MLKNLNSFRAVRRAIDYESRRQLEQWLGDNAYLFKQRPNDNRGWNDDRGVSELQRGKEEAHDYRYFPDPDLVPLEPAPAFVEGIRALLPELPIPRRARLVSEFGLPARDAETIIADRATADLFEAAVAAGGPPAGLSKQFVNVWSKLANQRGVTIAGLDLDADRLGALAKMVDDGTVSASAANRVAATMLETARSPEVLAKELGLIQVADVGRLAQWVERAIAENPGAVETILTNRKKAKAGQGFLRGQVMQLSGGQADPKLAAELIAERIRELKSSGQ